MAQPKDVANSYRSCKQERAARRHEASEHARVGMCSRREVAVTAGACGSLLTILAYLVILPIGAAMAKTLCSPVSAIEPAIRTTPGNRLRAIRTKLRSQA